MLNINEGLIGDRTLKAETAPHKTLREEKSMPGYPFSNASANAIYTNALHSLYAGHVMPFERDILAMAPLPEDLTEPFASQEVDPLQVMNFAYNSLVTWIDEAKKANYFSKRFVKLSRLVMNGVTTMGRGLMTLHQRGEDPEQAPMSIGDLIGVASYHFRKSYLGVLQTASSHPEISERLLMNQLGWTNTLLRLFKTREKLARPLPAISSQQSSAGLSQLETSREEAALAPAVSDTGTDPETQALPAASERSLSDADAFFELGAYSAQRAFSAFARPSGVSSQRSAVGARKSAISDQRSAAGSQSAADEEIEKHRETSGSRSSASNDQPAEEKKDEDLRAAVSGQQEEERSGSLSAPDSRAETGSETPDPEAFQPDPGQPEMPKFLQIWKNICERNESSGKDGVRITTEEMRFLADDPEYRRADPQMAGEFQRILDKINSS